MPYTSDKARRAQCRRLLDLSAHDLKPLLDPAGRLHLDTPDPSQQIFQAMLRFPRDAGNGDSRSDGAHERSSDDACPEEVPAGVA